MSIDAPPLSLPVQAPAEAMLHLLGGADTGGLDILLPGGVYALVPQSPPARFPLYAGFLKAAVNSARVCHVLLRTDPLDFLDRLEQSGWPQARAAWRNGSLRLYPMADGFSKLLFRRDVEGLTKELSYWGVASGGVLLVDAGDEMLSLHDLFMATGQLIKMRAWTKQQGVCMLLNFALAGAGSSMASLTGLMDHFSGMARLRSDPHGPVVVLDYWQSEWGMVAERTILLLLEDGALCARSGTHAPNGAAPDATATPATAARPDPQPTAAGGFAPAAPSVRGFFTDEPVWGRELRMLTGTTWQSFSNVAELQRAASEVAAADILLGFNQNTLLSELARNIHFLRAQLPLQTSIVVAEHRRSLRYANELMLMKMGADAVIRQNVPLERWPDLLRSLQSQTHRLFEKMDVEAALAGASCSKEKGVLELSHFVTEVQTTVEKAQVLGVPFAMAVLRSKHANIRSALLQAVHVRRTGDLLATDGVHVFVFFYACSLTMAPKVLDSVFDGKMARYVDHTEWMTREHDIHQLIANLREKQTTQPADPPTHEQDALADVASPAPMPAPAPASCDAPEVALSPAEVHAAPVPKKVAHPQWRRPNFRKQPPKPSAPDAAPPIPEMPSAPPVSAEENRFLAERRAAQLIRRLALPAQAHEPQKKDTGEDDAQP